MAELLGLGNEKILVIETGCTYTANIYFNLAFPDQHEQAVKIYHLGGCLRFGVSMLHILVHPFVVPFT